MGLMYEVQTYTFADGWTNTWHEDEQPLIFSTAAGAFRELSEFWEDLIEAGMGDKYSTEDYRVAAIDPSFEELLKSKVHI